MSVHAADDDWLPAPDGFIWPDNSNLPEFGDDQLVPISDLSKSLQNFLDGFDIWKSPDKDPKIYIHWIDLNEDSLPEIVVETIYGGSGGPAYIIATRTGDGYRNIGDFQGGVHITQKANGWYQLEGSARGGGGILSRYLLRYVKDSYEIVRNEMHDSIHKKVEISISKTQDAADPIENFAKELLTRVDEQYWWGIKEDKPPGGYLLRCEHDLNGDGKNELFLASTLEGEEYESAWTIYSPDEQNNYTKIASDVVFSPINGFYLKMSGSQRELQRLYHNPKFSIGIIDRYVIPPSGNLTHTKQELSAGQIAQLDADNWKETFGIGNEIKPAISKVLLAEYANNHAVQWRTYKTNLGVTEQNQDPADADAIASNSNFTLQMAKQLFGIQ